MASPGEAILTNPASDWLSDEAIIQQLVARVAVHDSRPTLAPANVGRSNSPEKTGADEDRFHRGLGLVVPCGMSYAATPIWPGATRPAKNKPGRNYHDHTP